MHTHYRKRPTKGTMRMHVLYGKHLEERRADKCNNERSHLSGRWRHDRCHNAIKPQQHWKCFKGNIEQKPDGRGGANVGFVRVLIYRHHF